MALKSIEAQHKATREDIADLITYQALPTPEWDHIDPFLLLNHHGPQTYAPGNRGLPFGPHPHRGFETVTFILEGELAHRDTAGYESVIRAGGVQWMTAGRGIIHEEVSPEAFKSKGGSLEILQLWVNLPSRLKMTDPKYQGLQREQIPTLKWDEDRVEVQLISGRWQGEPGAFQPLMDIELATLHFRQGGRWHQQIQPERNVFFYVVRGELKVNGVRAEARHLVKFQNDGDELNIEALADSVLLLGHALPYGEPIFSYGPFVMNTKQEILEAIQDYQAGKFE